MNLFSKPDIIAFAFLFFGCLIVFSLLKGIIKLFTYDWPDGELNALSLIKLFGITIISFILMVIFIFVIMPKL